ncbi:MAG: hypothetical protein RL077_4072 [Verrucomicrobiota bacterium]|jgi:transposase InsO family protein
MRTDLGTEFDGDTVHYRDNGFHGTLTAVGATHRFNPPAHPAANADVSSEPQYTFVRAGWNVAVANIDPRAPDLCVLTASQRIGGTPAAALNS